MRFPAISTILALGFALAVQTAPMAVSNPSEVSVSARSSPRGVGVGVLDLRVKQKRDDVDKKKGSKKQRAQKDLQKAADLRKNNKKYENKNIIVIIIIAVIKLDDSGRWSPPEYETMTQVNYDTPGASETQTQWITDDATQYIMGGATLLAPPGTANTTALGAPTEAAGGGALATGALVETANAANGTANAANGTATAGVLGTSAAVLPTEAAAVTGPAAAGHPMGTTTPTQTAAAKTPAAAVAHPVPSPHKY